MNLINTHFVDNLAGSFGQSTESLSPQVDIQVGALVETADAARHDASPAWIAIVHALRVVELGHRLVVGFRVHEHGIVVQVSIAMQEATSSSRRPSGSGLSVNRRTERWDLSSLIVGFDISFSRTKIV